MEQKINVAELLKDCPKGMELDCVMFEGLEFDSIVDNDFLPIRCRIKNPKGGYNVYNFTKYGCWLNTTFAKCVIFPKGKTTWKGFIPPCKFKDGDILYVKAAFDWICIYKESEDTENVYNYVAVKKQPNATSMCVGLYCLCCRGDISEIRLASEEEKETLFSVIKENGYNWNSETKTCEKLIVPKFKVGDKIKHKTYISQGDVVTEIKGTHYILDDESALPFVFQDEYELIPNKFDLNTLIPFESKVLVRDKESHKWKPAIWGFYDKDSLDYQIRVIGGYIYRYCIPYDGNEHLLATNDDCDDYYKTWK